MLDGDFETGILEGLVDDLGLFERLYAKELRLLTDADEIKLSIEFERLLRVGILDGLGLFLFDDVSDLLARLSFEFDREKVFVALPSKTSL